MSTDRREFLGRALTGAAALSGFSFGHAFTPRELRAAEHPTSSEWDVTWTKKITGTHKVVFDVPEIENGYGVWRASVVPRQYQAVLGTKPADFTTVLVLRHNAIALAMQQAYWDTYGIGKRKDVKHPVTLEPTDRNPALLSGKDGLPAPYDTLSLTEYLGRGGIALACNLALQDCVDLIQKTDAVTPEVARERAVAMLVPGVILQPSGVFAAVLAQEAGCSYLRAS
jgi:hypothetical protein